MTPSHPLPHFPSFSVLAVHRIVSSLHQPETKCLCELTLWSHPHGPSTNSGFSLGASPPPPLEHFVSVATELTVVKAFRERYILVLLKEYDLHFFDILQFQKPLANASTSELYFCTYKERHLS